MPPIPSVNVDEKYFVKPIKVYENGGYFYEFPKEVTTTNKPVFMKNINGFFFPATEDYNDDGYYYDKDGNFIMGKRGTYYGYYDPTKPNSTNTNFGKKTPEQRKQIIEKIINEQKQIIEEITDNENKKNQLEENYKMQQKQQQKKEKEEEEKNYGWWGYNKEHSMWNDADGGKLRKRKTHKRKTNKRKTHKRKTHKRKTNKT